MNLFNISHRSNINKKITTSADVIIYEDHRTILNVLFHVSMLNQLTEPLDIVMFDYHDDFCHPSESALLKIDEFLKNPSAEELLKIVEFDLKFLDDDWVKAGMELGLIGNVFLFNAERCNIGIREEYVTNKFGSHYMYNMGNVWEAISFEGKLNDITKSEINKDLWNDLGWELKGGKFNFKKKRKKFILDIDLDCFSTHKLNKTIAIPKKVIVPMLTNSIYSDYHHYKSPLEFILQLKKDSEFVTMCFENGCCGGYRQAFKIFNMVDELFFDGQLGEDGW